LLTHIVVLYKCMQSIDSTFNRRRIINGKKEKGKKESSLCRQNKRWKKVQVDGNTAIEILSSAQEKKIEFS